MLGRTPTVDPYALEFGEPVSEQINRMSLRFKRNQLRIKAGVVAQHMQDMYLGAIYPDVMTPEDVASVAGTGSLFVEDEDIQKALNAVEGLKESAVNDVEFERILSNERAMWLNRMSSYVQFIPSSQRVIDESNVNPPNPLPSTQVIQLEEEVKAEPKVTPTSLVSSEYSDFRRGYRSWRSKAVSSASKDPSKPTASSSAKEKN